MAAPTAVQMLDELTEQSEALKNGDVDARSKILQLCKTLTVELEQPGETFLRTMWANVSHL